MSSSTEHIDGCTRDLVLIAARILRTAKPEDPELRMLLDGRAAGLEALVGDPTIEERQQEFRRGRRRRRQPRSAEACPTEPWPTEA